VAAESSETFSVIRWPDPRRGPWGIRANWVLMNGRPECAGLAIWYGADQDARSPMDYLPHSRRSVRPITATEFAKLPIATIIAKLRTAARDHFRASEAKLQEIFADRIAAGDVDETLRGILAPSDFEDHGRAPVGAPRRYDRSHYVQVARVYLEAWQAGRKPTQAVADHFGVTRSAAAKWVVKARSDELGLLTPAEHGRSGARPGPGLTTAPTKKGKR
jgi:hypothetical protein